MLCWLLLGDGHRRPKLSTDLSIQYSRRKRTCSPSYPVRFIVCCRNCPDEQALDQLEQKLSTQLTLVRALWQTARCSHLERLHALRGTSLRTPLVSFATQPQQPVVTTARMLHQKTRVSGLASFLFVADTSYGVYLFH